MKLQQLFEEELDDKYAEWYEYIYRDCSLSGIVGYADSIDTMVKRLMKQKQVKYPYYEVVKSLSESERETLNEDSGLNDLVFSPGGISTDKTVYIGNVDKLGPPPFKILKAKWIDIGDGISVKVNNKPKNLTITTIPDWLPEIIEKKLTISGSGIKTFSNIHNIIKECGEIAITTNVTPKGGLLGFLKIRNLRKVEVDTVSMHQIKRKKDESEWGKFDEALTIINMYLKKWHADRDLLACQDELMDAGLEEYARL